MPIILISNRLRGQMRYSTLQFQLFNLGFLEHGALIGLKFLGWLSNWIRLIRLIEPKIQELSK